MRGSKAPRGRGLGYDDEAGRERTFRGGDCISRLQTSPDTALPSVIGGAGEGDVRTEAQVLDSLVDSLHLDGYSTDQPSVGGHSCGSIGARRSLKPHRIAVPRATAVDRSGLGGRIEDISELGRPELEASAARVENGFDAGRRGRGQFRTGKRVREPRAERPTKPRT